MMQDIARHKTHYSVLAVLAGLFVIYFLRRPQDSYSLVIATAVFSFCYFIWGVWHHASTRTLNGKIMLEYFLVSVMGIVIVSSLLL